MADNKEVPKQEQPEAKDPLDVMREHVVAAKKFGYSYLMMGDVINLIDQAKAGTLGEFKPGF